MKSIIFILIAISLSLITTAQKLSADKVSAAAKKSFAKAHPGATGTWEKENGNYEISFKENGTSMSCIISKAGAIIETETTIALSELPAPVSKYLDTHYKNSKVHEAARIVKANGEVNYEAEVNKKDVVFDEKGNFIKVTKD